MEDKGVGARWYLESPELIVRLFLENSESEEWEVPDVDRSVEPVFKFFRPQIAQTDPQKEA